MSVRSLAILLGAGASEPFGIPTMTQMVDDFEKTLKGEERSKWKEVKDVLAKSGIKPDLEAMLSVFGDPILKPSKLELHVAYYLKLPDKELEIIDPSLAESIEKKIREYIWKKCNLKEDPEEKRKQINLINVTYDKLFMILDSYLGASGTPERLGSFLATGSLDIYTTNYDRCVEVYFEQARKKKRNDDIQLNDGLSGWYWSPSYYKPTGTNRNRIYKLHGSIRYYWTNMGTRYSEKFLKKREMVNGDEVVEQMMIWPIRAKPIYQYPFSNMFDEMRTQLRYGTPFLVIGHSLRDEAIRDILLSVSEDISERRRRGESVKFKMLLMDPNADEIRRERLEKIQGYVTTVPHCFGTKEGFEKLSSILKSFKIH